MYNSDDATMQTIIIVNSHYITEGQYVAIILYAQGIFSKKWGNKGGEGEGEVEQDNKYNYTMYVPIATCLNETKKGGETSKSKILRILKWEI